MIESDSLVDAVKELSDALSPRGAFAAVDSTGGGVHSVTEAIMGITSGLVRVADSIADLAEAVRESKEVSDG